MMLKFIINMRPCNLATQGKACIRGLRFPVSRLLGLLASGESSESILKAYPYLEAEDIQEARRYARSIVVVDREQDTPPRSAALIVRSQCSGDRARFRGVQYTVADG